MVSVAIVGAGFSGLGIAIRLRQAGVTDVTIYEAAGGIGGTWRQNQYPGCACDVQTAAYSYSFEFYPWPGHYSGQRDILQYLHHCADKYGLWDSIKLNTRIEGARYDEDKAVWQLFTAAGDLPQVDVLILAQGPMSSPSKPAVPGLASFEGPCLHTAAWDSTMDLAGKKVAVVGTGASAIQVVPQLQQVVKELVVFQRTPAWVLPRAELAPPFTAPAAQHRSWLAHWLHRQLVFWKAELLLGVPLVSNLWILKKWVESICLRNLRDAVADPGLRQKLTPSFSLGCKRVLVSDDYYPAIAAPNVKLVPSALKEVSDSNTLVASNGEVVAGVDAIVLATGFGAKAPLTQFNITAGGVGLLETLKFKPESLYGTAIAGYPNMFTLLGLNTGQGHNSAVFMAECQMNLIVKLICEGLIQQGCGWVEADAAAQATYSRGVQRRLQRSVWLSGCTSWYLTQTTMVPSTSADTSSSGSNSGGGSSGGGGGARAAEAYSGGVVIWPGLCVEFWWRTLRPRPSDWVFGKSLTAAADTQDTEWHLTGSISDATAVVKAAVRKHPAAAESTAIGFGVLGAGVLVGVIVVVCCRAMAK